MVKSSDDFAEFCSRFNSYGLAVLGGLKLEPEHCPADDARLAGKYALLIGNQGDAMWQKFSTCKEIADAKPDPMNRWTRRVLERITSEIECELRFPFDKPFWPFQRIAQRASGMAPSPLGILIDPEFGLWHALRGLVVFGDGHAFASEIAAMSGRVGNSISPCTTCLEKPCLSACPVGAFDGKTLLVKDCFEHLDSADDPRCMKEGCRARDACPVGTQYRYREEQVRFHMRSFRGG